MSTSHTSHEGPWYIPTGEYDRHDWLQDLCLAIEVICMVLSVTFVGLRVYTRVSMKNFGWDDAWICMATVLSIAHGIAACFFIKANYMGIHWYDLPPPPFFNPWMDKMPWNYITGCLYNPILGMVRNSVLLFLFRLGNTKTGVRWSIWTLLVLNNVWMVIVFCVVAFGCVPLGKGMDMTLPGSCVDLRLFSLASASITIWLDILVLILPFWIFLGLRMNKRVKIAVHIVFLMGFTVSIISGIRLYFLDYVLTPGPPELDKGYSISYTTSAMEIALAMIAASAPAIWPLARRMMPRFFARLGISNGYQGDLSTIQDPDAVGTVPPPTEATVSSGGKSGNLFRLKALTGGGSGRQFATHTIGGSPLSQLSHKSSRPGGSASGSGSGRGRDSATSNDSEEEILDYHKMTAVMSREDGARLTPSSQRDQDADLAFQQSPSTRGRADHDMV